MTHRASTTGRFPCMSQEVSSAAKLAFGGSSVQRCMMRWMVLVALVGCSGAAALSVDGDDVVEPEADGGSSGTTSSSSGSSRDGGSSSSSGTISSSSSSSSGGSSSSGSTSSSSSSGSSSGGVEDAGEDAAPDASVVDAAPDAPPPVCNDGADRCVQYHEEACVAGQWSRVDGEACCVTVNRYTGADVNWKTDSQTNLAVHRDIRTTATYAFALGFCQNDVFAQLPTQAQLMSQILPSDGACTPGLDESLFRHVGGADPNETVFFVMSTPAGQPNAPPKCVDTTTGQEVGCNTTAKPAFICMR